MRTKYNKKMMELSGAYKQFVEGSKLALGSGNIEDQWFQYNSGMQRLSGKYSEFIEGSKKAQRYGSTGTKRFREQSGGLDPNPNITKNQFITMLRSSRTAYGDEFRKRRKQTDWKTA